MKYHRVLEADSGGVIPTSLNNTTTDIINIPSLPHTMPHSMPNSMPISYQQTRRCQSRNSVHIDNLPVQEYDFPEQINLSSQNLGSLPPTLQQPPHIDSNKNLRESVRNCVVQSHNELARYCDEDADFNDAQSLQQIQTQPAQRNLQSAQALMTKMPRVSQPLHYRQSNYTQVHDTNPRNSMNVQAHQTLFSHISSAQHIHQQPDLKQVQRKLDGQGIQVRNYEPTQTDFIRHRGSHQEQQSRNNLLNSHNETFDTRCSRSRQMNNLLAHDMRKKQASSHSNLGSRPSQHQVCTNCKRKSAPQQKLLLTHQGNTAKHSKRNSKVKQQQLEHRAKVDNRLMLGEATESHQKIIVTDPNDPSCTFRAKQKAKSQENRSK